MTSYRYLFGPVPSRRLGLSLGVDLIALKTCSSDCVFCQLGHTTRRTIRRREYVPTPAVLAEIRHWAARGERADYLTLAGSGEPTLHTRFGEVLDFIRRTTSFPTALFSNGTLFYRADVRAAARKAGVVKITLSAWDQTSFEQVTHPHPALRFERILEGYRRFREEYDGAIWLEVFLVQGVNASADSVCRIAALARTLSPDRIHLNTAVRPPAEPGVKALSAKAMRRLASLFTPTAEVIAEFAGRHEGGREVDERSLLSLLQRHAATADELRGALGADRAPLATLLRRLRHADRIASDRRHGKIYYRAR